jgi:hypothetical protein
MPRPKNAFIIELLGNQKKFAFTLNSKKQIVLLLGDYSDPTMQEFQVVKVKKMKTEIDTTNLDLNDKKTVEKILEPYIDSIEKYIDFIEKKGKLIKGL